MHVDTKRGQDEQAMLRNVLRVIAAENDPERCIELVLESILSLTGASGCRYVVFDDPHLTVNAGNAEQWDIPVSTLQEQTISLSEGLHLLAIAKGETVLAAPIHENRLVVGGVYLLTDTTDYNDDLLALIDSLSIVTARLRTQTRHDQAYQLIISVLHTITDPLLVLDEEKRVFLLNPAASEVFKVTAEATINQPFEAIVPFEELIKMVKDNQVLGEWTLEEDNRTFVPRIQPVRGTEDQIQGYVFVLRDITRFKQLNRNQSEFMRIVSHDLRSPLTSMQGFANMLELGLVGELNEKQLQFVEKILAGITQITALVDNIQDAGRYDPETGFYEMSRSYCDLAEIVHRIANNHLVPAEKQELTIGVAVDDNVPIINADANMLERAITNLVDNAIKYTPNGGRIDVLVKLENNFVVIGVRDTGLGISQEHQKQLFQRHVRIPRQEHKKIKGSGLGLFIVRSVAQRHGGDAWVESTEGKGSTFFMSIPLTGLNLVVSD